MHKTWLIFENGSYYSVNCSLHRMPKGHPRPVDSYLVTEHEGDFTIAARKAVHAVFSQIKDPKKMKLPVSAGFDLSQRTGMDEGLAGQSGGLSFAVCFAKKILGFDPGNVAATGIIQADGKIGRVKGIENKIKTAKELVNDNGIILFPEDNLADITPGLIALLEKESISHYPINHIEQVMDLLFGIKKSKKKSPLLSNKTVFFGIVLVAVCFTAIGVWLHLARMEISKPVPATIEIAIEPEPEASRPQKIQAQVLQPVLPAPAPVVKEKPVPKRSEPVQVETDKGFD